MQGAPAGAGQDGCAVRVERDGPAPPVDEDQVVERALCRPSDYAGLAAGGAGGGGVGGGKPARLALPTGGGIGSDLGQSQMPPARHHPCPVFLFRDTGSGS